MDLAILVSFSYFMDALLCADGIFSSCGGSWCAPCKQLAPLLTDAVRKSGGRLVLAKLNVDNNPRLAGQVNLSFSDDNDEEVLMVVICRCKCQACLRSSP